MLSNALLGAIKMKPPKKILVIITRRMGDVLLTAPLIRTLKSAWTHAELDVLVFENTRDVLAHHPDIRQVIALPSNLSSLAKLKWNLSLWNQYDLAVSALPSDRATFYAWLAGKTRVGLLEEKLNQNWKKHLLHGWVMFDNLNTHTVSMGLKLSSLLGLPPKYDIDVFWSKQDSDFIDKTLQGCQKMAVLHLYPKYAYKMWHAQAWIEVASWLHAQDIQVVLTGSSDPSEMGYIQALQSKFPASTLNLSGVLSFAQLACLIKKAAIYIGPDTVATHLSAAMGTPTVALFGPSNPVKWGPWPKGYHEDKSPWVMQSPIQRNANVVLLQGQGDCVPCFLEGCNRNLNSRSRCLDELSAQCVIDAIKEFL